MILYAGKCRDISAVCVRKVSSGCVTAIVPPVFSVLEVLPFPWIALANRMTMVFLAVGSPLVNVLRHCRGWCDRVDGCVLAEEVCDIRRSLVAITGDEFVFFCHNYLISYFMYYE